MLKLRLARVGKKKHPIYRLVVSESTKDMYGNHLEILGQYDPHTKTNSFNNERILYWISVGAQASETVYNLLVGAGLIKADKKAKAVAISKKRTAKIEKVKATELAKVEAKKAAEEAAQAAAAEVPATPVEEPIAEATENTETSPEVVENKE